MQLAFVVSGAVGGVLLTLERPHLDRAGLERCAASSGDGRRTRRRHGVSVRIDHIGIMVADLDAALRFYTETFGLTAGPIETHAEPPIRRCCLRLGDAELELIETRDQEQTMMRLLPHRGPGLYHSVCASTTWTPRPRACARRRPAGRRHPRGRRPAHPVPAPRRRAGHDDRAGHAQALSGANLAWRHEGSGVDFRLFFAYWSGNQEATHAGAAGLPKPRKSRFGRLTHCTGMRNGLAARSSLTSTVSR